MEYKLYGPYTRKDGRKHVILIYTDGSRRTVSYPKWLMEEKLGRVLDPNNETIDHKDGNPNNNDFDNLRILPRNVHAFEDRIRRKKDNKLICIWCEKEFIADIRNRRYSNSGPFCSRKCSGSYGSAIRNKRISLENNYVVVEHYKTKKAS